MLLQQYSNALNEAGCDEAGRGALAGPVVAAAVILNPKVEIHNLNDSKKLTHKQRQLISDKIKQSAIAFGIGVVSVEEIDRINILQASILAMFRALDQLKINPDFIIVDGNKFNPYNKIPFRCIVKGDRSYANISAASILAKTHRDEIMNKLHNECPYYEWNKNKGYPTLLHKKAILQHGLTPYHRKSFNRAYQLNIYSQISNITKSFEITL